MAYWLCVTSEDNWRVAGKRNVWGVADSFKGAIQRVRPRDKLVFYVMQTTRGKRIIPSRIIGIFKVVSELYRDLTKILRLMVASQLSRVELRLNLSKFLK